MQKGKLFLIPISLGDDSNHTLPQYVIDQIHALDTFIVERTRTARRFISSTKPSKNIQDLIFHELDKRDPRNGIKEFMKDIHQGKNIGLMSEAGCPGIADPGAFIVEYAHENNIDVVPMVGPSSILLALIASGMNGQNFSFNGYLPVKTPDRIKALKRLEQISAKNRSTQIFMETPYRNMSMIKDVLTHLSPQTKFCIAADITLDTEYIKTLSVSDWKKENLEDLHKRPAVFVIQSR